MYYLSRQRKDRGKLVLKARIDSYQKLLSVVEERANLQDGEYTNIQRRLGHCTKESLTERKAMWHRPCYAEATNELHIQRARDRMNHAISTGSYTVKKRGLKRTLTERDNSDTTSPGPSIPFTRSATVPLKKQYCFFCQLDDSQQLFAVRTEDAGKALRKAVEISLNPAFMTRLNSAISPSDAHAMDVQYHKSCWRKNVFRVLRDQAKSSTSLTKKGLRLQIPCLIELINLVDVQTKNKAYLPMDSVESMYISMLGGEEEAKKHSPTLTRKWLKDQVLSELPSVKSVRQKDNRKALVLYSPESCEEDMVHISMVDTMRWTIQRCYTRLQSLFAITLRHILMKSLSQTLLKCPLQETMFHLNCTP